MKHLLLDTSTERGFVALAKEDRLIEVIDLPFGLQNSKYLIPSLQKLLHDHQLEMQDIGLISCGVGPGSYTGIRIGAALAQAIAYAHKIPLTQFSSLESFIPPKEGHFAAVIDAKIGGVYALFGEVKGNHIKHSSELKLIPPDQIDKAFQDTKKMVGPAIEALKGKITFPDIDWYESAPSVRFLAELCFLRYKNGFAVKDEKLNIIYLRNFI